jgi:hypothetical protein
VVAVVVAILPEPVYEQDKKGANSPYFREPLDLVVGMLEDNGDLILYHFDSRRFEPANSKDAGH